MPCSWPQEFRVGGEAIARPLRGSVQNALGAQETDFRIRLVGGAGSKVTSELRWTSKQGQLNEGLNV